MPENKNATVHGTVAEGFEGVREEFGAFVAGEADDPGAQLAAYHHGRLVVDLWNGDSVTGDSLTGVYSATKGAAHLVVALLVQDGVLELDKEVAFYWPEFAAEGKGSVTLRDLLAHRSGAVGADDGFSPEEYADDRLLAARLAGQRPFWRPGAGFGYHALVIGALTGEVVRRVTGQSIQEIFEERIRAPYALDLHLGLPEELEARYRPVLPMLPTEAQQAELAANASSPQSLVGISFGSNGKEPLDLVDFINTRAVRAKGQASAGGVGNARGLAGMYAAVIGGVDGVGTALLDPGTYSEFSRIHSVGRDLVTGGEDNTFGLGFQALGQSYRPLGADAIGHSGAAGALALADPRNGVSYAYTRRRFAFPGGAAPENERLIAAVLRAAVAV
ncbi:serine hydrolase domain-containing protein [Streptomyces beijiangensis]|uniref:Beta-lactamase family protein n=1 Tax=Streptomyces beijiangensis TaxID=163361 RepID=A0A939FBX1_9ACTN|nr:serine hydrolase domain-containing protein [Streptomyces beijiangensis]MBO0514200.1 beta-lactamase family protein [Streptomyces beijiangensis]